MSTPTPTQTTTLPQAWHYLMTLLFKQGTVQTGQAQQTVRVLRNLMAGRKVWR